MATARKQLVSEPSTSTLSFEVEDVMLHLEGNDQDTDISILPSGTLIAKSELFKVRRN